jgi:hypothetical protein
MVILLYLLSCALVGYLGRLRVLGFWGYFALSVVFTPFVIAIVLLVGAPRRPKPHGCNEAH